MARKKKTDIENENVLLDDEAADAEAMKPKKKAKGESRTSKSKSRSELSDLGFDDGIRLPDDDEEPDED